jgi:beta-barrel assembly-enhancing protease
MKRCIALAAILTLAIAGLVLSERRHVQAEISPAPILYFVADTERELMRIPVSLTRMSEHQEVEIGDDMASRFLDSNKPDGTPEYQEIASYISSVGTRVAANAHRKLPYKFHYIPDQYFVNAFSLPGGHVFIGRGLLDLMDTEDELANVLGHEIEHADLGHCVERAQIESRIQRLPLGDVMQLPVELFEAGYSKDQELEADREGTKLAEAAGYSAQGAIDMLRKYQKLEDAVNQFRASGRRQPSVIELPFEVGNVVVLQTLEGYFRSHPPAQERITQLEKLIASQHWPSDQKQKTLAVGYLLLTDQAENDLLADKLDKALATAKKALTAKLDYAPALVVVGAVDFEKGDFASAAEMYGQALRLDPTEDKIAVLYASSLSASTTAPEALARFNEMVGATPSVNRPWFIEERTGLQLMTGDTTAAKSLAQELAKSDSADAPTQLGRIGWWYYRFGDVTTAAALIGQAVEQRPQISWLSSKLGWVLIAQRKYESAQQRFSENSHPDDAPTRAEVLAGVAVSAWNQNQPDLAVSNFRWAAEQRAAWLNPHWVAALYGQQVSAATQAIHAESERRKKPLR